MAGREGIYAPTIPVVDSRRFFPMKKLEKHIEVHTKLVQESPIVKSLNCDDTIFPIATTSSNNCGPRSDVKQGGISTIVEFTIIPVIISW